MCELHRAEEEGVKKEAIFWGRKGSKTTNYRQQKNVVKKIKRGLTIANLSVSICKHFSEGC